MVQTTLALTCYVSSHIFDILLENLTTHKNRQTSEKFGGFYVPKEIESKLLSYCCCVVRVNKRSPKVPLIHQV